MDYKLSEFPEKDLNIEKSLIKNYWATWGIKISPKSHNHMLKSWQFNSLHSLVQSY